MINPKATKTATENEDGFWDDGFPVDTDSGKLTRAVEVINQHIKTRARRQPETREDFGNGPDDGAGLKLRRKRMGSTWDFHKHYLAEFGLFAGLVDHRWVVLIQDLFYAVYGFAEYTSMADLHAVWELD